MSETNREVELRMAIADPTALDQALRAQGATIIGQGLVRTTSYDYADGHLRAARQTLRLREDWTGLALTSKRPLGATTGEDAGGAKVREEVTLPLPVASAADARSVLDHLGLRETIAYDKQRTSWQLGAARIDLDVLADGGACYAEIEADADDITTTRTLLGLDTTPVETRSYFDLVQAVRKGWSG